MIKLEWWILKYTNSCSYRHTRELEPATRDSRHYSRCLAILTETGKDTREAHTYAWIYDYDAMYRASCKQTGIL